MESSGFTSVHRDDSVRIGDTPVGKGVFSKRGYPANAVLGEITGDVVTNCSSGSRYSFEIDDRTQLDPHAPFRFLNHSCEPNCEFDWFEDEGMDGDVAPVYLIALRDIRANEELTIDYNWPAIHAIRCHCTAASCRGWIVSLDELDLLDGTREEPRLNHR
ncbi:MAG: SET domain-containing protein [Planctomycetaceae bacterium]|nr:SET domain-containing protein [Planctomycetaceae bacterium]